jgi:MFS family permease
MSTDFNRGDARGASALAMTGEQRRVVLASSLGLVFEWYDLYLYGSLVDIMARQFFPGINGTAAFILALLTFAAGFVARPFGALVFGWMGDRAGRKRAFFITVAIMGVSTVLVGLLPSYASIGIAAPILLVMLRLAQGFGIGGEYGGAVTFMAEHATPGRRGFFTSWLQTTATLGLLLALLVTLGVRSAVGETAFAQWGWRLPFLGSVILLVIVLRLRSHLGESPAFARMKTEGRTAKAPLAESFGRWANLKRMLLALFGLTAGQAVVWYTGQFYALFFLTQTLSVDPAKAQLLMIIALAVGMPFFVVFGAWSDRIGRKRIIMAGCLLAALGYVPLFKGLAHYANPDLKFAQDHAPVVVVADPATCAFQFHPVGEGEFVSGCDQLKSFFASYAVHYTNQAASPGANAYARIGRAVVVEAFDGAGLPAAEFKARNAQLRHRLEEEIRSHGYPAQADPAQADWFMVTLLLVALVILSAMVYGPLAALLVEMFPLRLRYTSMGLPYHIGNGWFGGLLNPAAFAIVAATGDVYGGLWYPIGIALMTFVVGSVFLRETKGDDLEG